MAVPFVKKFSGISVRCLVQATNLQTKQTPKPKKKNKKERTRINGETTNLKTFRIVKFCRIMSNNVEFCQILSNNDATCKQFKVCFKKATQNNQIKKCKMSAILPKTLACKISK